MSGDRWKRLMAEHGSASVAALYVLHRLLQRTSGSRASIVPYLLVAQPVGNPALASVRPDPATEVRRITPGDPVTAAFPRPAPVLEARFAAGAECHVAWVKGTFAGHIWLARGRYLEDEVRCTFEIVEPNTGVWDYDVYIEPHLRLGRTMARLWKAVDDTLATEGVQWSFSRINRFNIGSVKAHQRLGATTVGQALFVVIGPLQLALLSWAPWLHISLREGPALRLAAPKQGHSR